MKYTRYACIIAAAAMLASCGNDNEPKPNGNYPEDGKVRIRAAIAEPERRSAAEYTGDNLSFFLKAASESVTRYNSDNVMWVNNGGSWSSSTMVLWPGADTPVEIYAYAPYLIDGTAADYITFNIATDQSAGIEGADFVYECKQDFVPSRDLDASKAVNLLMKHALVKLTLNLTMGDEFEGKDVSVQKVVIRQTAGCVDIDITEPNIKNAVTPSNDDYYADVTMHGIEALDGYTYEAIFYPSKGQTPGERMITVYMSDGKAYSYTVPASGITLEAGCAYSMNLKIGKDKLSLRGVYLMDWNGDEKNINGGEAE